MSKAFEALRKYEQGLSDLERRGTVGRRSGKTTGIILEALGLAMQHPGQEIQVVDHFENCRPSYLGRLVGNVLAHMQLEQIQVLCDRKSVYIVSHWYGIQDEDDCRGPELKSLKK